VRAFLRLASLWLLTAGAAGAAPDVGSPPPLVAKVRTPGGYAAVPAEDFLASVQQLPFSELQPLAAAGRPDAQIQLARLRWMDGDTLTPIDLVRPHAQAGIPVAQYLLGTWLRVRNRDLPGALAWLTAAAGQGHPLAQEALAAAHEGGQLGLPASPEEAFRLYLAAGRAGLAHAQLTVALALCNGRGVAPDKALGRQWLANSQQGQLVPVAAQGAGCD
jgi:hypothetical protein